MNFCLKLPCAVLFSLLPLAGISAAANASFVKQNVVAPRVRSVVRADARSGRLVRTVVVTPRVIQPVVIGSASAAPDPADADASVSEMVETAARKYDVDPLLVHSVIQVESSYNPYAISPKGAQGLMQLMPGTARRFGVANAFDARDNIEGGVRYLKYLQTLFPNDPRLAVAAYNAGEGAVWKYNNRIPPYRETEDYVYRVAKKYGQARRTAEQQKKTTAPVRTAEVVTAPSHAPVESFIDSEGRLHMRTVPFGTPAGGSVTNTP